MQIAQVVEVVRGVDSSGELEMEGARECCEKGAVRVGERVGAGV